MKGIFAYIELATAIIGAVGGIQHLVSAAAPVSGTALLVDVQPVIWAVQSIYPKLTVPMDLAANIADAAAVAINKHFGKG